MTRYYVNKNRQANGDHEVHKSGCDDMPNEGNRLYLGTFDSCHGAVREAKKYYPTADGCFYCSRECHTS